MPRQKYAVLLLPLIKKHTEMEVKALNALLYMIGIPGYIYTLYVNLGTWKSDILMVAALMVLGFNTYWKWRKNLRLDRKEAQEAKMREIEMMEREAKIKGKQ